MPRKRPAAISTTQLLEGVSAAELRRRLSLEAPKDERLEVRLSKAEKELVQRLAEHYGVSVSALLVALAKVADERMGRDHGRA